MPESRSTHERTAYYTMKTSRPSTLSSHNLSSPQPYRPAKSSTPMASPCPPHSVGQTFPPKLSPAARNPDVRAPSPNYFGLTVEQTTDPREPNTMPRENWSPPSSSVKSFAAALPKQLPLDANPEFEAFKRQADANRSTGFDLGSSHMPSAHTPPSTARPRPPRWHTHGSDTLSGAEFPLLRPGANRTREPSRMDVDRDSLHDSAYVSGDSKRNSEASLNPPSFFNLPRNESPAQYESALESPKRTTLSKVDDRHPRMSLHLNRVDPPSPRPFEQPRSVTNPPAAVTGQAGPSMIVPAQLKEMMSGTGGSLLVLDIRVSPQYAQSRIQGALNLCIPTTLLKRATYNLQKLQQTFAHEEDQIKFSNWRSVEHLVVYDAFSSEKRDAGSALNMLKKFTNEGYTGNTHILRGGFKYFSESEPQLVDHRSSAELGAGSGSSSAQDGGRPNIPPVIGGVMLPSQGNSCNPFFSNIRQNMDLADGVGQMDIALPAGLEPAALPEWLRDAAEAADRGKRVSDNFLKIELAEQARMKNAYSSFNQQNFDQNRRKIKDNVQLSGIEKGVKNRYKDILPFEHARVKLQGKPTGSCDYVNASHIQASRSNKRYIATQGPLPATFEDFWSVIWDQDVRVIVMLTAESEGGLLKCHPYWTGEDFGPIRLRPISEKKVSLDIDKNRVNSSTTTTPPGEKATSSSTSSTESGRRRANTTTKLNTSAATPAQPASQATETPYVIIRKFALSHNAHPFAPIREITHLHYPSWPDFGAPAQPSHLLALVELANVMQRAAFPVDVTSIAKSAGSGSAIKQDPIPVTWYDEPEADQRARPMLVHCSAGCGRTGTFCTVDSVIDMLKRQRMAAVGKANTAVKQQQIPDVDAEGDVSMDDTDCDDDEEPASPQSAPPVMAFPITSAMGVIKDHKSDNAGALLREKHKAAAAAMAGTEDIDVGWMRDDRLDLIEKTVSDFRIQRLSMVQSLRQFVLCYETVVEWVWRSQEKVGSSKGRIRSGSLAG